LISIIHGNDEEWYASALWERRRGGLVVGLRQGRAGGNDIVVMHGLVILNRWCLAVALDAKFA